MPCLWRQRGTDLFVTSCWRCGIVTMGWKTSLPASSWERRRPGCNGCGGRRVRAVSPRAKLAATPTSQSPSASSPVVLTRERSVGLEMLRVRVSHASYSIEKSEKASGELKWKGVFVTRVPGWYYRLQAEAVRSGEPGADCCPNSQCRDTLALEMARESPWGVGSWSFFYCSK